MDQTSDHGASDRLRHRPAGGDAIGGAEFAVSLAKDALGAGDQDAVGAARARKKCVERAGDVGRRRSRLLDRTAKRPGALRVGFSTGNRLQIELHIRVRPQDDPAIAVARNRGADNRLAEAGVIPADRDAAIGIFHVDDNVAAALRRGEFGRAGRRGPEPEPARSDRWSPAEMPLGGGAVEAADIAHVDETLGREVRRALA